MAATVGRRRGTGWGMNGTRGDEVQFGRAGRAAGAWLTGTGLLAAHVSVYLLAGVGLLLLNLFRSPTDLWVDRPLLVWAIVLIAHAALVGTKRVTRRWMSRMTTGQPMPRRTSTRHPVDSNRPGRTAPAPSPIRPRFRPIPVTPLVETPSAIRPLATCSQDIAVRGIALATRASRRLAAQGRDFWDRQAREALIGAGSQLKDVIRRPRNTSGNQMVAQSGEEQRGGPAENRNGAFLPEREDARVKVNPSGSLQTSAPAIAVADQRPVAATAAPAPAVIGAGAAESLPSAAASPVDNGAPEGASSPWGSLPSWARIRPNGSDEGASGSSDLRGGSRLSPIDGQSHPSVSNSQPAFGMSARRTDQDDDVVIDEAPVITKETEWTWMEAAAASWLARRERQDRPDPGQNAHPEPVDETPLDPERLHA